MVFPSRDAKGELGAVNAPAEENKATDIKNASFIVQLISLSLVLSSRGLWVSCFKKRSLPFFIVSRHRLSSFVTAKPILSRIPIFKSKRVQVEQERTHLTAKRNFNYVSFCKIKSKTLKTKIPYSNYRSPTPDPRPKQIVVLENMLPHEFLSLETRMPVWKTAQIRFFWQISRPQFRIRVKSHSWMLRKRKEWASIHYQFGNMQNKRMETPFEVRFWARLGH